MVEMLPLVVVVVVGVVVKIPEVDWTVDTGGATKGRANAMAARAVSHQADKALMSSQSVLASKR